ncbi:MAG: AAA family ATPase [Candidatus Sumerlaeota bacterium]|nr:AAA family ATPase [Candidatus Sumerlaeota bacterium]
MTAPIIAFFSAVGGVGNTSLVYHIAWMFADKGVRTVAVDLDPQANLTAAFLAEDRLEELWPDEAHEQTIYGCLQPLILGLGDIQAPHLEPITDYLSLVVGDLALSKFEDQLSEAWPKCSDGDERAFRVTSAFWRIMQTAASNAEADLVLVDLGPNLGAINRAALISANYIVMPLALDLFSLQGLKNLGPTLGRWNKEWAERLQKNPASDLSVPTKPIQPIGYIVMQHSERLNKPTKGDAIWAARIPGLYSEVMLNEPFSSDEAFLFERLSDEIAQWTGVVIS